MSLHVYGNAKDSTTSPDVSLIDLLESPVVRKAFDALEARVRKDLGVSKKEVPVLGRGFRWVLAARCFDKRPRSYAATLRAIERLADDPALQVECDSVRRLGGVRALDKWVGEAGRAPKVEKSPEERAAERKAVTARVQKRRADKALKALERQREHVALAEAALRRMKRKLAKAERSVARYRELGVLPPEEGP